MKTTKQLLTPFVSKHDLRGLNKVYFQADANMATNSYIGAMIKEPMADGINLEQELPDLNLIDFKEGQEITIDADYLYVVAKFFKELNTGNKKLKSIKLLIQNDSNKAIKIYQEDKNATCFIMPIHN